MVAPGETRGKPTKTPPPLCRRRARSPCFWGGAPKRTFFRKLFSHGRTRYPEKRFTLVGPLLTTDPKKRKFCVDVYPCDLAPTGLPIVECKQRALRCRCTYYALIFRHQTTSGLQLLIGQHSRAGRMLREYLKLLGRETAPVLRVLPGADNIETRCLCWGMNKTFHCGLLSCLV